MPWKTPIKITIIIIIINIVIIIIIIIKIIIISFIIIIILLATMASLKHKEKPHYFIWNTNRFILWND